MSILKEKTSQRVFSKSGFTFVEIGMVTAIIGLLVALTIPFVVGARKQSLMRTCVRNLHRIQEAKLQWAIENNLSASTDANTTANKNTIHSNYFDRVPACPAGGTYNYQNVSVKPTCSLSARGHELK